MSWRATSRRAAWVAAMLATAACGAPSTPSAPQRSSSSGDTSPPSTATAAPPPREPTAETETTTETASETTTEAEPEPARTAPEPAPASVPAVTAPMDASAPMRAQLQILERQTRELEQVASQVAALRPLVAVGPGGVPAVCEDRAPIEALRIIGTSGSAGASAATGAVRALEEWCAPFDEWTRPDDRALERVRSYLAHVERIVGWLADVRRCESTTGAERARCENAYSDVQREAAEEASRGLALLDRHLRELAPLRTGAARFPCSTPTLVQISTTTWTGSVARAQLGSLAERAMSVCRGFGVSEDDLRDGSRRVLAALDRAETSARAQRRSGLEAIESLRPYVEPIEPIPQP